MSRVSTVVAETALFAVTLWKLFPHLSVNYKARSGTLKLKGLASIMLHDGLAYAVVSSVLISRFLLDLQQADRRTAAGLATDDDSEPQQSFAGSRAGNRSIGFASALGSLGASIDPAHWHYGLERDDEDADDPLAAREGIHLHERQPSVRGSRVEDEGATADAPRGGDDSCVAFGD
ncbi:hypothetical protein V8D89_009325 [Ganoderma adspersum]